MCWILEVIYFVTQSDFFASQMFSTHSILCVGYLKSFLLSHSQISLLARCFPHTILCVYLKSFLLSHSQISLFSKHSSFPDVFHTFYSVCWILEVISFVTQSDFFASQMFSTHSILCVGYLKSFILSHSQISLLARCFPHILFCVLDT